MFRVGLLSFINHLCSLFRRPARAAARAAARAMVVAMVVATAMERVLSGR